MMNTLKKERNPDRKQTYARTIKGGIFFAAAGALVAALILACSDFGQIRETVRRINLRYIIAVLMLIPLNFCIKGLRYSYYLRLTDESVAAKDVFFSLMAGSTMVITPGKFGEMLMRGYLLKVRGYSVPALSVCAMTLADRLTEGFAMIFLTAITFLTFQTALAQMRLWGIVIVFLLMTGFIVLLQHHRLCVKLLRRISERFPGTAKIVEPCIQVFARVHVIFGMRSISFSTVMGIFSWLIEAGVVCVAVAGLGQSITLVQAAFAVSLSGLIGAISMIPGGIGISDGTLLGNLLLFGLDRSVAGTVTIISRFSTMWFGVLFGAVALLMQRKNLQAYSERQ